MKNILLLLLFVIFAFSSFSQKMNNKKLDKIYNAFSDSVSGNDGYWQMFKGDFVLVSISDKKNNRMRIIMPIIKVENMEAETMEKCLKANFHTALDVKYAISDGIMWSIFVHPLKELSDEQVEDALQQVLYAALTFGGSYSSTNLVFPDKEE